MTGSPDAWQMQVYMVEGCQKDGIRTLTGLRRSRQVAGRQQRRRLNTPNKIETKTHLVAIWLTIKTF